MENKKRRVFVYPADLKRWAPEKSDKAVYCLYHQIQATFNLARNRCLTIFHMRDYYNVSLDDVRDNL